MVSKSKAAINVYTQKFHKRFRDKGNIFINSWFDMHAGSLSLSYYDYIKKSMFCEKDNVITLRVMIMNIVYSFIIWYKRSYGVHVVSASLSYIRWIIA